MFIFINEKTDFITGKNATLALSNGARAATTLEAEDCLNRLLYSNDARSESASDEFHRVYARESLSRPLNTDWDNAYFPYQARR